MNNGTHYETCWIHVWSKKVNATRFHFTKKKKLYTCLVEEGQRHGRLWTSLTETFWVPIEYFLYKIKHSSERLLILTHYIFVMVIEEEYGCSFAWFPLVEALDWVAFLGSRIAKVVRLLSRARRPWSLGFALYLVPFIMSKLETFSTNFFTYNHIYTVFDLVLFEISDQLHNTPFLPIVWFIFRDVLCNQDNSRKVCIFLFYVY